jgi:hypothetical protein
MQPGRLIVLPVLVAGLISACGSPRTTKIDTAPCSGVDRGLTNARKSVLAPALARQLHVSTVDVLQSFAEFDWSIIYVETQESDPPFLFFSGDPLSSHYVTLWAGAAMEDEEQEIRTWTIKNAPGIPPGLASCFAWHVTRDPGR